VSGDLPGTTVLPVLRCATCLRGPRRAAAEELAAGLRARETVWWTQTR